MVLNGPQAMNSLDNAVEVIAPDGQVIGSFDGSKETVAEQIFAIITRRLIAPGQ